MPQFAYRARNAQGALVEGVLDCADRAVAIRQIEQQRCIPIKIDIVGAAPPNGRDGKSGGPEKKRGSQDPLKPHPSTQNLKIPHGQLLIFT